MMNNPGQQPTPEEQQAYEAMRRGERMPPDMNNIMYQRALRQQAAMRFGQYPPPQGPAGMLDQAQVLAAQAHGQAPVFPGPIPGHGANPGQLALHQQQHQGYAHHGLAHANQRGSQGNGNGQRNYRQQEDWRLNLQKRTTEGNLSQHFHMDFLLGSHSHYKVLNNYIRKCNQTLR